MQFPRHFIPLTLLGVAGVVIALLVINQRDSATPVQPANTETQIDTGSLVSVEESDDQYAAFQTYANNVIAYIHIENDRILEQRKRLDRIANEYLQELDISEEDFVWIKGLAEEYQMEPRQRTDRSYFNDLRARVDRVPAPLVLAHLALENQEPHIGAYANLMRVKVPCKTSRCIEEAHKNADAKDAIDWMYSLNTHPDFNPMRRARAKVRDENTLQLLDAMIAELPKPADNSWNYAELMTDTINTLNLREHQ